MEVIMSDDIIFIKDEYEYNEYRKLSPQKIYYRKKVKFICSCCGKESVKTFRCLTKDLICKKCTNKAAQSRPEVKAKVKNTVLSRYGGYTMQSDTLKEKVRHTNIKKYGVENVFQNETIKEKIKQTYKSRYGVEYPGQSVEIKKKMTNSIMEHYGVEHPCQSDAVIEKYKQTFKSRYGVEYPGQAETIKEKIRETNRSKLELKYKELIPNLISYGNKSLTIYCDNCKTVFTIPKSLFFTRFNFGITLCTNCFPYNPKFSQGEKELVAYIASIYDGSILENDRTVIAPKELDIYLPDKKLAIEFDGTYWHADPRFFNENDEIDRKSATAKEIWEKDRIKERLCESIGIRLFRVKEYDWKTDTNTVKSEIKKIIKH